MRLEIRFHPLARIDNLKAFYLMAIFDSTPQLLRNISGREPTEKLMKMLTREYERCCEPGEIAAGIQGGGGVLSNVLQLSIQPKALLSPLI